MSSGDDVDERPSCCDDGTDDGGSGGCRECTERQREMSRCECRTSRFIRENQRKRASTGHIII